MPSVLHRRWLFALFSLLVLATPEDAHAYLDPGTGSMLVQALVASVMAVLVTLKLYWRRIKSVFVRGEARDDDGTGSEAEKR